MYNQYGPVVHVCTVHVHAHTCTCTLYNYYYAVVPIHVHTCMYMNNIRDNKQGNTTQHKDTRDKENELPQVGLLSNMYMYMLGMNIHTDLPSACK